MEDNELRDAPVETWACDAPISMPQPPRRKVLLHLDSGGFGFTDGGLCFDLTEEDRQNMINPHYGPVGRA